MRRIVILNLRPDPDIQFFALCNVMVYEKESGQTEVTAASSIATMQAVDNQEPRSIAE